MHFSDKREPKGQSKTHFSIKDLHNPNQAQMKGNDANYSRDHIQGPAKSTEPTKSTKF
jgi:hypothetical protein